MRNSYLKYIILPILYFSLIVGCSDESKDSADTDSLFVAPIQCLEPEAIATEKRQIKTLDYGDGTEGELYLSKDQQFLLEAKAYSFLNIYAEEGSELSLTNIATSQDSVIELNSIGSCDFHGDIILPEYTGTLIINCYSQINLSGNIDLSKGKLILKTPTMNIINPSDSTNLQDDFPNDNSVTLGEAVTITTSPSTTLTLEPINYEPITLSLSECSKQ